MDDVASGYLCRTFAAAISFHVDGDGLVLYLKLEI